MVFKNFTELIKVVQGGAVVRRVAVVAAQDEHTLEAVFRARKDGIAEPILVGDCAMIQTIAHRLGESIDPGCLVEAGSDAEAAEKAVALIREEKADFLMKGKLQTADLLRAVVNKETGLRTGSVMSHMAIHEVPGYHKLLAVTDGGMMMYPDVLEKKQIIENAVRVFRAMGYETPKVAVLAAVETPNPKMPEAVDADVLKGMNKTGELADCILEGPISYDLAMSRESAHIKGFESPVVEDADILVVPNITAGNILGKALVYSAGAKMAGFVVGAKVPIVLTSRGSSSEEKYLSIVLSASAVQGSR